MNRLDQQIDRIEFLLDQFRVLEITTAVYGVFLLSAFVILLFQTMKKKVEIINAPKIKIDKSGVEMEDDNVKEETEDREPLEYSS